MLRVDVRSPGARHPSDRHASASRETDRTATLVRRVVTCVDVVLITSPHKKRAAATSVVYRYKRCSTLASGCLIC
eukprot:2179330-Prymnesium_polylepis.1